MQWAQLLPIIDFTVCLLVYLGPVDCLLIDSLVSVHLLIDTFDTVEAGLKVGLQFKARPYLLEVSVGDWNVTAAATRALLVRYGKNIGLASDVSHIHLDALVELHSSIGRSVHHDHLVVRTASLERFPLAIVLHICTQISRPNWSKRNAILDNPMHHFVSSYHIHRSYH